ncbi:MAG: DUF655 domain-containing protein [Candidatus Nanoarchaeia archaeon]|nr:DUF655 domain-containing protein [Candidatus Nanoarchaeia archaeon]
MIPVKEENAIVLDFLPNGYPFDNKPSFRKSAIAQAIGKDHFVLLELIPKKETELKIGEEVYIGEGKRDKIHHVIGKIDTEKLTQTAKLELESVLTDLVDNKEKTFVEFFNKAGPINMRRHQFELLPGIGKKHMWEILEARKEGPFGSFEDIKTRVRLLPDPRETIIKRIMAEINNEDKYKLFVGL